MTTLFMVQLGATPKGRLIEQHDMFFGVADKVGDLIDAINAHWPAVKNKWHIDSYRSVTTVINPDGSAYHIEWQDDNTAEKDNINSSIKSNQSTDNASDLKLFFINLGGYQEGSIEEFHYKMLVVAPTQATAMKAAATTEFYKHYSYNDDDVPFNAASHIDNKHQVDVDDIYDVNGLLSVGRLVITPIPVGSIDFDEAVEDKNYVGYLSLKTLKSLAL